MRTPTNRLLPALLLFSAFVVAGCSDQDVTAPADPLLLDDDMALFMAEVPVATTRAPEERAQAAVDHGKAVLARATELLASHQGFTSAVEDLLTGAEAACERAEGHLANGNLRVAVHAAMTCANLAREAVFLARSERLANMQDRAASAIAEAEALVAAAAARVSDDAPEAAHVALERAREALALATVALEERRFNQAVALANRASVLAERILRVLG